MAKRSWIKVIPAYAWAQFRRCLRIKDENLAWAGSGLEETLQCIELNTIRSASEISVVDTYEYLGKSRVAVHPVVAQSEPKLAEMLHCLEEYDAYSYPHAAGTFEAHLIGTWHILACWHQPREITRCGLFHSAYATDVYPIPLVKPNTRDILQTLIGEEAEALVFLFCTMDRQQLRRDLAERDEIPADGLEIRNWITGERLHLASRFIAAFVTLEIANLAEQMRDRHMVPGMWVSHASRMAGMLRGHLTPLPPIFDACSRRLQPEEEERARRLYIDERQDDDPVAMRRDTLLEICEANPWVAEPYLDLAQQACHHGQGEIAGTYARQAWQRLLQWGTTWDKRRSWADMVDTAQQLAGESTATLTSPIDCD